MSKLTICASFPNDMHVGCLCNRLTARNNESSALWTSCDGTPRVSLWIVSAGGSSSSLIHPRFVRNRVNTKIKVTSTNYAGMNKDRIIINTTIWYSIRYDVSSACFDISARVRKYHNKANSTEERVLKRKNLETNFSNTDTFFEFV